MWISERWPFEGSFAHTGIEQELFGKSLDDISQFIGTTADGDMILKYHNKKRIHTLPFWDCDEEVVVPEEEVMMLALRQ